MTARQRRARAAGAAWTAAERKLLERLDVPAAIQAFLDSIPYSADPIYRCPRSVMRDRKAHCFDGAVFAAAALRHLGFPARLLDLRAERDDDHVLALFERRGRLGAIAKSNYATLRWREPVYRTRRELAMSYFDFYFNTEGEKSMRSYSTPVDLHALDALQWTVRDEAMEVIASRLNSVRHVPVLTPAMARALAPVDDRTYRASMFGTDPAGLYKPKPR